MRTAAVKWSGLIQTLRAFRRAANVDVSKELKSEMTVDEGVPARQLGKPN